MTAHVAGSFRLLLGLAFAYLAALAFAERPLSRRHGITVIVAAGGLCSVIVILQAIGIDLLTNAYYRPGKF